MEPALPIDESLLDDLPENSDVMSMSAEQFLVWVRMESEQLPGVVRIDLDPARQEQSRSRQTAYMPAVEDIPQCPVEFMPCAAWANDVCFKFSEIRAEMYNRSLRLDTRERRCKVPSMKDESNWRLFCFGDELDKSNRANEDCQVSEDMEVSSDTEASMSDICIEVPEPVELEEGEVEETSGGGEDAAVGAGAAPVVEDFDIVATKQTILKEFMLDDGSVFQLTPHKSTTGFAVADIAVLRPPIRDDAAVPPVEIYPHNVNPTIPLLLQFDQVLSSLLFSYHVNWLSGLNEMGYMRGAWLYALMARLLKPLPGDVSSTMRQLYRQSCIMRFVLVDKYITIKNINEIKSGNKCGPLEKHVSAIERGISVSEDDFECKLGVLNTIIVITGLYFGQGEDFAQLSDT